MKPDAAAQYMDLDKIVKEADHFLCRKPVHITSVRAANSKGDPHAFYSNGDYWWPNPDTPDGLPFIQRDGETYPGIFTAHRMILREMRRVVTHLAAAFHITGRQGYADAAASWLRTFFLAEDTRMAPHLCYAQAIPGVSDGRGIGIIDTMHLIDVPPAIELVRGALTPGEYDDLKAWFQTYLHWMNTHPNGLDEREWSNNHAVMWYAQATAFARFTADENMLAFCRDRFKTQLVAGQMAADGSFPAELARTKPYYYASMTLDALAMICLHASSAEDNLWHYQMDDGRGLPQAIGYLLPFIEDKSRWPYPPDIEHHEALPVAMPYMLFAGLAYNDTWLLSLWQRLPQHPENEEIRRSIAIRCPYVYLALA